MRKLLCIYFFQLLAAESLISTPEAVPEAIGHGFSEKHFLSAQSLDGKIKFASTQLKDADWKFSHGDPQFRVNISRLPKHKRKFAFPKFKKFDAAAFKSPGSFKNFERKFDSFNDLKHIQNRDLSSKFHFNKFKGESFEKQPPFNKFGFVATEKVPFTATFKEFSRDFPVSPFKSTLAFSKTTPLPKFKAFSPIQTDFSSLKSQAAQTATQTETSEIPNMIAVSGNAEGAATAPVPVPVVVTPIEEGAQGQGAAQGVQVVEQSVVEPQGEGAAQGSGAKTDAKVGATLDGIK